MNTYLTIITTVLVISQIVRVIQNEIHLKQIKEIREHNELVVRVHKKWDKWLDRESEDKV